MKSDVHKRYFNEPVGVQVTRPTRPSAKVTHCVGVSFEFIMNYHLRIFKYQNLKYLKYFPNTRFLLWSVLLFCKLFLEMVSPAGEVGWFGFLSDITQFATDNCIELSLWNFAHRTKCWVQFCVLVVNSTEPDCRARSLNYKLSKV